MKTFMIIAATAVISLCGVELIVIMALGLPFALESVWTTTRWMAAEPLLFAASILILVLVIGRGLDYFRQYTEDRSRDSDQSGLARAIEA